MKIIKKLINSLLLVFLLGIGSIFINTGRAIAGSSIDQQYTAGAGTLAMWSGEKMAQRFMPSMTILDKVELELTNVGSNQKVSIGIRHSGGGLSWDAGYLATVYNQTVTPGWNVFDFTDITVSTSPSYGIFIIAADYGPHWKYCSDNCSYGNGYAIWQSQPKYGWDFNFKTWGANPVDIVADNTQPTDNNTGNSASTGQTTGSNSSPASTTSASIKAPANLTAKYTKNLVNLSWTKSDTTGIDGYKVFRSESKTTNFKEIGKTINTTVEYTDNNNFTVNKTYYYMVRAYKANEESASSNTAEIKIPKASTSATTGQNISNKNPFLSVYSTIGAIAIVGIILGYIIYQQKKKAPNKRIISADKVNFGDGESGETPHSNEESVSESHHDEAGTSGKTKSKSQ